MTRLEILTNPLPTPANPDSARRSKGNQINPIVFAKQAAALIKMCKGSPWERKSSNPTRFEVSHPESIATLIPMAATSFRNPISNQRMLVRLGAYDDAEELCVLQITSLVIIS